MTGDVEHRTNRRRAAGTTLGHAIALVGMTYEEAAEYLECSLAAVRSYASGARPTPAVHLSKLADLWSMLTVRAEPNDVPPAVLDRWRAIQELRERPWSPKATVTRDDVRGKAGPDAIRTALALHLASRGRNDGGGPGM